MGLLDGKREWNPWTTVKTFDGIVRAQGFELVDRAGDTVGRLGHFKETGGQEYGLQLFVPQTRQGEEENRAVVRFSRIQGWGQPPAQLLTLQSNSESSSIIFHDSRGGSLVVIKQDHDDNSFVIRFASNAYNREPSTTITHDADGTTVEVRGTLRIGSARLELRPCWVEGEAPPEGIRDEIKKAFKDADGPGYHVVLPELGRAIKIQPDWLFSSLPADLDARDLVKAEIDRVIRAYRYQYSLESDAGQTEVSAEGIRVSRGQDGVSTSVEADGVSVTDDDRADSPAFFGLPGAANGG